MVRSGIKWNGEKKSNRKKAKNDHTNLLPLRLVSLLEAEIKKE